MRDRTRIPSMRRKDLKEIADDFGDLFRDIVETRDSHGLKERQAWPSTRRRPSGSFEHVVALNCEAEAGLALQKRLD